MGIVFSTLGALLGLPSICVIIGADNCRKMEAFFENIGNFFSKYYLIIDIVAIGSFLVIFGGIFAGYFTRDLGYIGDLLKTLAIPFEDLWEFLGWLWDGWLNVNRYLAELTHTMPELWNLVELTALLVSVLETLKSGLGLLLRVDSAGYPAKIFGVLSGFVAMLSESFDKLELSSWNPVSVVAKFVFLFMDLVFALITPFVNLLNPFQWYEWLKKLFIQ